MTIESTWDFFLSSRSLGLGLFKVIIINMQCGEKREENIFNYQMTFPRSHGTYRIYCSYFHSSLPLSAESTPSQQHFHLKEGIVRARLILGFDAFTRGGDMHRPLPRSSTQTSLLLFLTTGKRSLLLKMLSGRCGVCTEWQRRVGKIAPDSLSCGG